jgi:hypothetical protein
MGKNFKALNLIPALLTGEPDDRAVITFLSCPGLDSVRFRDGIWAPISH